MTELAVDLRRDGVLEQVRLDGLGEATATALIASRASASPNPGFVHWVLDRTDGNPFFIEELLRGGLDVGSVPDEQLVPEGVLQHVVQRLGRLSADTVEALRIAAAAGAEFDAATIEPLTAGFGATLAAVEEAIASGLIREVRGRPAGSRSCTRSRATPCTRP